MKNNIILIFTFLALIVSACSNTNNTPENESQEPTVESAVTAPTLDELQKDDDVLWVGMATLDYAPNYNPSGAYEPDDKVAYMKTIGFENRNASKFLKYQPNDINAWDSEDKFLVTRILENRAKMTFYKSSDLKETYTAKEVAKKIASIDTFEVVSPETGKKMKQVIVNDLNPDDIHAFRVKQLVYYSKKEVQFKVIPLAIAPVVSLMDDKGTYSEQEELFWMNINFLSDLPDMNTADVTWAKRLYRNCRLNQISVLKDKQSFAETINTMMEDIRSKPQEVEVFHTFSFDGEYPMEDDEKKVIGASVDTIITFDPKTFKEIPQVVNNNLDGKQIEEIRFIQDWVWNETTNELSIRYFGFAPTIHRYDDKNYFLNAGPIFVRRAS